MTAIDPRQTLKEKLPNKWAIVILGGPGRNRPGRRMPDSVSKLLNEIWDIAPDLIERPQ